MNHFAKIAAQLRSHDLDGVLLTNEANRFYASGFHSAGTDGMALVTPEKFYYFTDSRYTEAARRHIQGADIREAGAGRGYSALLQEAVQRHHIRRLGFEDAYMTVREHGFYARALPCELVPAADLLADQGIQAEVLKLNQISPLEYETLAPWLAGKKLLAVAEDAFGAGCVGQRTAAILAQHGQAPEKLVLINLGKTFLPEGTVPQLEHQAGIDAAGIARAVQEART